MFGAFILISLLTFSAAYALENGLARTPPMGWSTWLSYSPEVQCYDMRHCMSERMVLEMAQAMVREGYSNAGYKYVILDDCWQLKEWRSDLSPDPRRFSRGIAPLANDVHNLGLKFGIFTDLGKMTGGGYPGSSEHLREDAFAFASWSVDYVKASAFDTDRNILPSEYVNFGRYLRESGRPIVYATSWPIYYADNTLYDYQVVSNHSNTWRISVDTEARWDVILNIMDDYARQQDILATVTRPGSWNDLDALAVGLANFSEDMSKSQMAVWSIVPSPLILGCDLRYATPAMKAIIQNFRVIAINQDPLGQPGKRIRQVNGADVWMRRVSPQKNGELSIALAFVNRLWMGNNARMSLWDLGLRNPTGYAVSELYSNTAPITMFPRDYFEITLRPTGTAFYFMEPMSARPYINNPLPFHPPPNYLYRPFGFNYAEHMGNTGGSNYPYSSDPNP